MLRSRAAQLISASAVAAALAGCGDDGRSAQAPRPSVTNESEGRPIGGEPNASAEAIATSLRFVRGYLALQAGRRSAGDVPAATPELRQALERQRIPPASQDRRTQIAGAQLEHIDPRSARVTVEVRNVDEPLTYPLPIDLVRRDGRWTVLSAGDDT